jgi:hypothetical protein
VLHKLEEQQEELLQEVMFGSSRHCGPSGTDLQPSAKSSRRGRHRKYRFRSTLDVFLQAFKKRRAQEYLSERPKLIFECLIKIINTYSICTFFCIRFILKGSCLLNGMNSVVHLSHWRLPISGASSLSFWCF